MTISLETQLRDPPTDRQPKKLFSCSVTSWLSRLRELLPHGGALPDEAYRQRHRLILALLYVHALGVVCFGLIAGHDVAPSLAEGAVVVAAALAASLGHFGRRAQATLATTGLLVSSAMLVHLSGGFIEMHVDFLVLVVIVALYEQWLPFLLAVTYVVGEHALALLLPVGELADYPNHLEHPLLWIAIHGGFIIAVTVAGLLHWRIDEASHLDEAARRDASEQRARLVDEQRAHAVSEATLRRREELLSVVSHDLKDPLGTIKGNAQWLRRGLGSDDPDTRKVVEGLDRIDVTATRMAELLDELLDLSELAKDDQSTVQPHPTDLVALARRVAGEYDRTIASHHIEVRTMEPAIVGYWEAPRIERAIANLLLHATLRTSDGCTILIELASDGRSPDQAAVIQVLIGSDAPAIPPQSPTIDRFHRVANLAGGQGADPGIAFARRIVERHGGSLSVEREAADEQRITVRLPLAPRPA